MKKLTKHLSIPLPVGTRIQVLKSRRGTYNGMFGIVTRFDKTYISKSRLAISQDTIKDIKVPYVFVENEILEIEGISGKIYKYYYAGYDHYSIALDGINHGVIVGRNQIKEIK